MKAQAVALCTQLRYNLLRFRPLPPPAPFGACMNDNKLLYQYCIAGMNALPAGSIDLAFADPPFNIGYEYDLYEDKKKADDYLEWTHQWGKALVNALKPTGTFWLAIGDDFAAELKLIFQRELGLTCRSWVIWYY